MRLNLDYLVAVFAFLNLFVILGVAITAPPSKAASRLEIRQSAGDIETLIENATTCAECSVRVSSCFLRLSEPSADDTQALLLVLKGLAALGNNVFTQTIIQVCIDFKVGRTHPKFLHWTSFCCHEHFDGNIIGKIGRRSRCMPRSNRHGWPRSRT